MTGAQASYLQTLAEEAHEPIEPDLTKAEASKQIDRLQAKCDGPGCLDRFRGGIS
jgi:hypothetical protein